MQALALNSADLVSLAIGGGDCIIRIWQTRNNRSYECRSIWKGVQAKVRAVSIREYWVQNWEMKREDEGEDILNLYNGR